MGFSNKDQILTKNLYIFKGCGAKEHIMEFQGCGLGLDVSISRCTNVSSPCCLEKNCQRLSLGRQASRSQPFTSCAQDQFSAKLCRPH